MDANENEPHAWARAAVARMLKRCLIAIALEYEQLAREVRP